MRKINGYQNEYEFVKYLNGKVVNELNPMFINFLENIFYELKLNSKIECWLNPLKQKSDFFIKIDGVEKGISLKSGIRNSVHVEAISEFIHFLIENNVDRDTIIEYLKYHYADGSTNGKGSKRVSVNEYKIFNQKSIDKLNEIINNETLLNKVIDKFILKGNNSEVPISALIYGNVDDFIWITSEDIRKIVLSKIKSYSTAVHFGPLTCQPKNRCLNYNPVYEKDRYCVQLKWYNILDDIIENMNNKVLNQSEI